MTHEFLYRGYALPLVTPTIGARQTTAALVGTAVGYASEGGVGWACAPHLVGWPGWQATITEFARDLAKLAWIAQRQGRGLPHLLAEMANTTLLPEVPLAITCDEFSAQSGDLAAKLQSTGIRTVKVKVGSHCTPRQVEVWAGELRQQFTNLSIRLDANNAFANLSVGELQNLLTGFADAGVDCIEDPAPWQQWPDRPALPLALDLLDCNIAELLKLAGKGRLGLAVIKPALCGPVSAFFKLMRRLAEFGTPVAVSSCFDPPLGLAQLVALAAAAPGRLQPCGLATHLDLAPAFIDDGLSVRFGNARPLEYGRVGALAWTAPPWRNGLQQTVVQFPDGIATTWRHGESWLSTTWQQLDDLAQRCADRLWTLGCRPECNVAVWADNDPQVIATLWGIWRIGAIAALGHPKWTSIEFNDFIGQCQPTVIVSDIGHPAPGAVAIRALTAGVGGLHAPCVPHAPHAVAAIVATSGTSGQPKLVRITYDNLATAAYGHWQRFGHQTEDCWLCPLPLCHVSGLVAVWRCTVAGVRLVLVHGADVPLMALAVAELGCTLASLVPTQLRRLLDAGVAPVQLRLVLVGGSSVPIRLLQHGRLAGWPVIPSYGMTETTAQVASGALSDEPAEADGYRLVGLPMPGAEVRIAADDEIWLRGPQVAGQIGPQWLATGDCGRVDSAGRLWVASRRADRVIRGGESIDPLQVEAALLGANGVVEAAVVGIADDLWGEQLAAWVVFAPGQTPPQAELEAQLGALAPFKRPTRWHLTDQPVPRNSLGKIDSKRLVGTWLGSVRR